MQAADARGGVHPERGYITVKHPLKGGFFVRERGMKLRMLIPKGRIREGVTTLLVSCGVPFAGGEGSNRQGILHRGEYTIRPIKDTLKQEGIEVRPC